jgi:hypothetical protein
MSWSKPDLCVIVSGVSVLLCPRQLKWILSLALRYQLTKYPKIGNNFSKLSYADSGWF